MGHKHKHKHKCFYQDPVVHVHVTNVFAADTEDRFMPRHQMTMSMPVQQYVEPAEEELEELEAAEQEQQQDY